MRVIYHIPTEQEFERVFDTVKYQARGGGHADIRTFQNPIHYQRGSGAFSVIGSLLRSTLPFIRRMILPAVGEMFHNVTKDVSEGSSFRKSVKKQGINTLKQTGHRILRGGGGRRRKKSIKKRVKNKPKNKRKYKTKPGVKKKRKPSHCKLDIERDIFSDNYNNVKGIGY